MLEYFICVDVDRTILRSTVLFDECIVPVLENIARARARDEVDLSRRLEVIGTLKRDMVENLGKSFDFLAVYNERVEAENRITIEQLAEQAMVHIEASYGDVPAAVRALCAPGTEALLAALQQLPNSKWGFVTSGGRETQGVKLLLLRRLLRHTIGDDFRAKIISTEHKTRDVDSVWRQPDGTFSIPVDLAGEDNVRARHVIVIDDKQKNLEADTMTGITTILVEQLDMPDDGFERVSLVDVSNLIHNIDK